ncbi:MAG TPA: hypothetical protein VFQ54_10885, partial [Thermomicrobiales bacterium]|nr:hypothetical protein [Thermomicrobiales bacterium]
EATICLLSALEMHGLTDEIPQTLDLAIPRGMRLPAGFEHVTWHHFAPETFEIGREPYEVTSIGHLGVYDAPRTIVDLFRLRYREGSDLAYGALKTWLRRRESQPSDLLMISRHFPQAHREIQHALEIML